MLRNRILKLLVALELAFPPGVSYPEDNTRHHGFTLNTYGDRVELGLHLWLNGRSQTFFVDDADLDGEPEEFIAALQVLINLNGDVHSPPVPFKVFDPEDVSRWLKDYETAPKMVATRRPQVFNIGALEEAAQEMAAVASTHAPGGLVEMIRGWQRLLVQHIQELRA